MSRKMTRILVALLLLATFTAGAASAAPWSLEPSPLAALWEWITVWFQSSTVEEGPHMDPDGLTTGDESSGENPDEGSQMDPDG